ncbi:DUF3099 domain-containing protein [Nocardioides carbamazepini]|uniref:DUF3099 domain-containing protein n=1 Tax=Nocardioides carbamazepini TaxID=2854259 RepID=UPI002149F0CE|nr:DUF3099 domain-containing protein [Nocardioides carbamazepini]MCR1782900.1 DUF3099 domain-containing protein [Nocardioides carbamazepini]
MDAIRITTAGSSPQDDLARRQKKYVIAMTIRTLCFIGAAITGAAGIHWLWPILIAGAIILPYVAVVMANAEDSRATSLPLTGGGDAQRQLGQAAPGGQNEHGEPGGQGEHGGHGGHGA